MQLSYLKKKTKAKNKKNAKSITLSCREKYKKKKTHQLNT